MENHAGQNPRPELQKLGDLIKGIKYAMLTTIDVEGYLRSRPMATEEMSFDGDLWFFTNQETPKVLEIRQHNQVNVAYSDPNSERFVSVSGTAEPVRDRAQIEKLWNPLYRAWFPNGVEDPDLILLRIRPEQAQYWDLSEKRMTHLFSMAKTILTGQPSTSAQVPSHRVAFPS